MSQTFEGELEVRESEDAAPGLATRWPKLLGTSDSAHKTIGELRIACVSAGSVASRIADHCARMQIAEMLVVDPAHFKRESLLTHAIGPESIGRAKAEYVAERCRQISPVTKVTAWVRRVQDVPPSTFADYDLIFAATDNLNAESATAQLGLHLGIPLLLAAVHGETLTAQVKLFANVTADSPCPVCLFNEQERSWQAQEASFSCAGGPADFDMGPTRSTSFLCSLAADLAVAQAVRWFLALGDGVGDTELTWCAYSHRVLHSPLVANANCPLDHSQWLRATTLRPIAESTIDELLSIAHLSPQHGATISVEGYALAEQANCCGQNQLIGRFVLPETIAAESCRHCGSELIVPPFYLRRSVPLAQLSRRVKLRDLGATMPCAVLLSDGNRTVLVRDVKLTARSTANDT